MLSQLTIRTRLFAAFAVVLALMLAVAGVGGLGVNSARQTLDALRTRVLPLQSHADRALQTLLRARVAEQAMLANNLDNAPIAKHKQAWDTALKNTRSELDALRAQMSTAPQLATMSAVDKQLGAYQSAFEAFYKDLGGQPLPRHQGGRGRHG
jgi:hypothetical protein